MKDLLLKVRAAFLSSPPHHRSVLQAIKEVGETPAEQKKLRDELRKHARNTGGPDWRLTALDRAIAAQ